MLNRAGDRQDCHSTTAPRDSTSGDNSLSNTSKWRPLMPPSAFVAARKECNLGEASKESTACDKEKSTAHDRENKENDPLQSPSTSLSKFSPPIQLTGCSGVTILDHDKCTFLYLAMTYLFISVSCSFTLY